MSQQHIKTESFPIPLNPSFATTTDERLMLAEILTKRAPLLAIYGGKASQVPKLENQCRDIGTIHRQVASHDPHYTLAVLLAG